jgi:anti-sigma-K factor RskA
MISDDDLLLYYYRDGLNPAERARIGAAISSDPGLAQRLHRLVARLDAAAALPEIAVPVHVRQRWQVALERAAQANNVSAPRVVRSFTPWLSAAAAIAVVALLLVQVTQSPSPDRIAEDAVPTDTQDSAYERGLKFHLASTEQQLASLDSARPEERARLIETIVSQNRIYALAAERAGEPQLARVLRAFSPILESLAHDGNDSSASIAQLSFELRVMQGRLSAGSATPSQSTTL